MPDPHFLERTLSVSALVRHDRICDQFENGWQAGSPPRIEDLLKEVPESEEAVLFVALLRVELERRMDSPGPDEYRIRFPELAGLVDTVFGDPANTGPFVEPGFEPPNISGYAIAGTLGQGGMGVVFRARDLDLNRPVAIKMVRPGVCSRPDQLVRFQLEARSVAGLSHPNVVPLYDFGHVAGQPYLVMELVDGGSLAERLDGKPAEPGWAAALVEQLAGAVHHIHGRKIIHRDLKPANVLLAGDGTPKITDFGLAKVLVPDDPGLTATYAVLGTACYMSPEQARGDSKSVGPASDVYSLGGILYECLTGRPPFRAATYALTVAQVLAEDPTRPLDIVADLPADLEAVCLKCLEKDPVRRYTAAELADDLARYRQNLPVLARPLEQIDRHSRWARRIGYEIRELLDGDGTGFTYLARQVAINRTVRLKLGTGTVGSPSHVALRREADAMAGLEHPNVIRLYDYGEQFGQPYLVLEYLEGGHRIGHRAGPDLDIRRIPMATRPTAQLALLLAIGLQAIHEHGVVHGGLRPDAIVLARDGTPKIGHFAAARRRAHPRDAASSPPEWVHPRFQSPEVRAGDLARIGPASDIYALGAILHDLLIGDRPDANGESAGRLPDLPSGTDPLFAAIVFKCLEPEPERRYPSAGALALAVQLFLSPEIFNLPEPSDNSDITVVSDDIGPVDRSARYRLRVMGGSQSSGNTFDLPRYRVMIGRAKGSTVLLPGKKVSRVHCGILWNPGEACHELVDLGAFNGTSVNGRSIKGTRRLAPGDRIQIANYTLLFELLPEKTG